MPERNVPNFNTVSDTPRTGNKIHFSNGNMWTLVVTGNKVSFQEVPPDKLSYTLEGFRDRMTEVFGCITNIEI